LKALREKGPTPLHRMSFAPVWMATKPQEVLEFGKRECKAPVLLPAAVMKLWHERRAGSGTASTAQFIGDPAVGRRVC
jgi:hypothetical protein